VGSHIKGKMKTAFTVVTANYLAQAKTVADSFKLHNPDYEFLICLVDRITESILREDFTGHEIVEVDKLEIDNFENLYFKYNSFELSNALKPFFAEYILERSSHISILIYLDSDVLVFGKFGYVENLLQNYQICITPHIITTIQKDDQQPDESNFLNAGIYNGGFFAIASANEGIRFIKWWKEKLRYYCFHNVCNGLYVDQIWLNYVPIFFEKVFIIKHPGYNAAYYNLHERFFSGSGEEIMVNGDHPLVFYHFTGYDINKRELISKYQTRFSFDARPDISVLYSKYENQIRSNKHDLFTGLIPYYQKLRDEKIKKEASNSIGQKHEVLNSYATKKVTFLFFKVLLRLKKVFIK